MFVTKMMTYLFKIHVDKETFFVNFFSKYKNKNTTQRSKHFQS